MNYYPIFLDIRSKRCVIVGGGEVAWRKARRLLNCGAVVTVVSRQLGEGLREMKMAGLVLHIPAAYDAGCLEGASLVIGATDQHEVNERIALDAAQRGLLVNIADDPAKSNFILPSLVEQGDLVVSISTGGKSPALARKLREDMSRQFGPEYAILLNILGWLRPLILAGVKGAEENKRIFHRLVNSELLGQIRRNDAEAVAGTIREITGISLNALNFLEQEN
ncbi:MAG: bifunctional precorrin-2 dehydrogenase/sirohydrochlorin ferrochelatase [Smithellaceae bacterium]|nr:bifunctional precorrin-2 dehydrogenase/sirohydrochlorin ferrochelatase [Smithellaceae bacterium]